MVSPSSGGKGKEAGEETGEEEEGEEEEEEDLPTPDGLSPTEASLLRWVRAVVELFDARTQVEPYRLRLREKERQLARMQREQERSVEEQHEKALKAAAQHGIPTSLFPLEAPWSLFPWYE